VEQPSKEQPIKSKKKRKRQGVDVSSPKRMPTNPFELLGLE